MTKTSRMDHQVPWNTVEEELLEDKLNYLAECEEAIDEYLRHHYPHAIIDRTTLVKVERY